MWVSKVLDLMYLSNEFENGPLYLGIFSGNGFAKHCFGFPLYLFLCCIAGFPRMMVAPC